MAQIRVYTDYKSPYAYVANKAIFSLEDSHDVTLDWLPLTLHIADYLDAVDTRSPHNWRKVKYAYMDARRSANAQGLTLKGPRRIYDGYLSSAGLLFAKRHGIFRAYHDLVFELFWTHQLDIDEIDQMKAVVARAGGDAAAFEAYVNGPGRAEHDGLRAEAETLGVFGVPTMIFEGELFWGGDRVDMLKARLDGHGLRRSTK